MTITTETSRSVYNGNGVTTVFNTVFQFFDEADLVVTEVTTATGVEVTKTLTTHYTVSGGSGATGSVTMLTAPASGKRLVIQRVSDLVQDTDLIVQGEIPSDSVETRFDKLTLIAQEAALDAARAIRTNKAQTGTISTEIPLLDDRAGYVFVVNDDEDGFDLADIADLSDAIDAVLTSPVADDMIVYTGGQWVNRTPTQVRTHLSVLSTAEVAAAYQPLDAELTSLSGASANGVSLVTAANYAAMRALLDLEAGTDFLTPAAIAAAYQPLDAELTSLSGASANGVSLVTAANYAAMRTLLTLAAADTPTFTGVELGGTGVTDTTLTRASAGVLAVEGHAVPTKDQAATISALYTFSAGLAFANETLSTYDEGTFTPGIAFGGGTTGITYAEQVGIYVKIGQFVWVCVNVTLSNKGSSTGNATITGMPFTSMNSAAHRATAPVRSTSVNLDTAGSLYTLLALLDANTTAANLYETGDNVTFATITEADFGNSSAVAFALCYRAAS
jgi:hypothetical protein